MIEALDSHVYCGVAERGDRLPVNNGAVWLPGDYDGPEDRDPFWPRGHDHLDDDTTAAIDAAREVRTLEYKLRPVMSCQDDLPRDRSHPLYVGRVSLCDGTSSRRSVAGHP